MTSHVTLLTTFGHFRRRLDQPQKRTSDTCCLCTRINLVTLVGVIYDHTVVLSINKHRTINHLNSTQLSFSSSCLQLSCWPSPPWMPVTPVVTVTMADTTAPIPSRKRWKSKSRYPSRSSNTWAYQFPTRCPYRYQNRWPCRYRSRTPFRLKSHNRWPYPSSKP